MPDIIIVTGEINSGKTTRLEKLIAKEKARGNKVTGIIARGVFLKGQKIGYDVEDLITGESLPLARIASPNADGIKTGNFIFSEQVFHFANSALLNYFKGGVVFLDEAGPLELAGGGYSQSIRHLLKADIAKFYMVIRQELLDEFKENFFKAMTGNLIVLK